MRTCYLHLGMPKTGSTSIQESFFGYEDDKRRLCADTLPRAALRGVD